MPDSYTTRRPATIDGDTARWTTNTGEDIELPLTPRPAPDGDNVVTEQADGYLTTLWYRSDTGSLVERTITAGKRGPIFEHDVDAAEVLRELRRGVPVSVLTERGTASNFRSTTNGHTLLLRRGWRNGKRTALEGGPARCSEAGLRVRIPARVEEEHFCPIGGTGRHTAFRAPRRKACGFDPRVGHTTTKEYSLAGHLYPRGSPHRDRRRP